MHGNLTWLGLPVGEQFGVRCKDIVLQDSMCVEWIVKTISQSYAKAYHYEAEMPWIKQMLESCIVAGRSLVKINLEIIVSVLVHLNITTPKLIFSSAFETENDPTRRVIQLCKETGTDDIIVGTGSNHAVHDWSQAEAAGIRLRTQDFLSRHPIYSQTRRRNSPFQPGLSVIDAILNIGSNQTRAFLSDNTYLPA